MNNQDKLLLNMAIKAIEQQQRALLAALSLTGAVFATIATFVVWLTI